MDHLLRPEGVGCFIRVPYNEKESGYYDDKGFMGFPKRRGWTEQDLLGANNFGGRSSEEVECFFQTWLFFGMVIEVLKAAKINVQTEVFLRAEPGSSGHVIHTERLPSLLIEWKMLWPLPEGVSPDCACEKWIDPNEIDCKAEVCWKSFDHARDSEGWQKTIDVLDRVCFFMDRYCTKVSSPQDADSAANHAWPVRNEISASILALGFTLRAAAIKIYGISGMRNDWGTGTSALLRDMIGRKWCKSDAALAMEDLPIDGQYYIALSPGPSEEYLQAHKSCGEGQCISKVKAGAYKTKHATGCEKSNCRIDFCYRSYDNDGNLDPEKSPSEFEAKIVQIINTGGTPIIKWNDAGGDITIVEYNEIKGLKPKYVAISHVWLDGMGNEHQNSLPKCQLSRIQRMVDEIPFPDRGEDKEIGFWMDTLCVPVRDDFYGQKKTCIHRMRYIYQEAAAVLVLDSWLCQIESKRPLPDRCLRVYQSNWQRRLWTFQEGCLAKQLYFQFSDKAQHHRELTAERIAFEEGMNYNGIYVPFCAASDTKVTSHFTLVNQTVSRMANGQDSKENMWILYLPLADGLGHRQTTKMSDETLCLSTILGLDPQPYLDLRGRDNERDVSLAERRMQIFLRQIRIFNSGLIFNSYPRLSRNGFRWAPQSLLGSRTSSLGTVGDHLYGQLKKIGPMFGLIVRYPGVKCKFGLAADTFSIGGQRIFSISEKNANSDTYYFIELKPGSCQWNREVTYGLVFARKPEIGQETLAMIGSEVTWSHPDDDGEESSIHFLRHECNAVIKTRSGVAPSDTPVLRFYGRETEWMIM